MAGVKSVTPGFALDCFGQLYLVANSRRARIKFSHAKKELRPILLKGVQDAIRIPRHNV
jgi:hypothetical protein